MNPTDPYAFRGGPEGADRLEMLDTVLGPRSRSFLREAGLAAGMRVLEVGCGPGLMTSWIARAVGPAGAVTAVDADPRQLELAGRRLREQGHANVQLSPCRLPDDALPGGAFELVYGRFVLMHVPDVEAALGAMVRALEPGGLLVLEEATASSAFTSPPVPVADKVARLFGALGRALGVDFDVGDRLFELARGQGCAVVRAQFVQPMVPLATASRFLALGAGEVWPVVVKHGLMGEAEAQQLLEAIRALSGQEGGYYAFGRVAQIAARARPPHSRA